MLSALSNRAALKATVPRPPQCAKKPPRVPYRTPPIWGFRDNPEAGTPAPNSAPAPALAPGGRGEGRGGRGRRWAGPRAGLRPLPASLLQGAQASHRPPTSPASAGRSIGRPQPVTSAAGAGARLRAVPHPSARAREPCLPSPSSRPPAGRGGGWRVRRTASTCAWAAAAPATTLPRGRECRHRSSARLRSLLAAAGRGPSCERGGRGSGAVA